MITGGSLRTRFAVHLVAILCAVSSPSAAQSPADKATARKLATDGIGLYTKGEYVEALDRLQRAQALYQAPIHLLYIARSQVRLGKLVDGAETYRRLLRTQLDNDAPRAFKDALSAAQRELADLEPNIPTLRIDVTPANAEGLKLFIDGQPVSAAVVGVDRPTNPGQHVVEARANGYATATTTADLASGSKQTAKLTLRPSVQPKAVPTKAGEGKTDGTGEADQSQGDASTAAATQDGEKKRGLELSVGLRIGAVSPSGKIDAATGSSDDRKLADRFGSGGQLELRAGLSVPVGSFAITPLLSLAGAAYANGGYYDQPVDVVFPGVDTSVDTEVVTRPQGQSFGLGATIDTAPRRPMQFGGFAELLILPVQRFSVSGTITQGSTSCDFDEQYQGVALQLGVGALLAVTSQLRLTGQLGWAGGSFSSEKVKAACSDSIGIDIDTDVSVPSDKKASHSVTTLGLGAEYLFPI